MAHAITYGSATHYKASATRGHTRVFAGSYEFNLVYSFELVRGWVGGWVGGWRALTYVSSPILFLPPL